MKNSLKSRISDDRRKLENPYAHLEYFEASETEAPRKQPAKSLQDRISSSRKLLENQYAYLNELGGYSADTNKFNEKASRFHTKLPASNLATVVSSPGSYSNRQIESLVRDLHTRLWQERTSLWHGNPPSDPIALLDPAIALQLIGYEFSLHSGLGQYRSESGTVEIAGLIDRTSKQVHVSHQLPLNVRTFTTAHELGHAVLHPASGGIHRDRPLDGASLSRDLIELEADKFATYFLMPSKLVRARFTHYFKTSRFELNEDTAIALANQSLHEVQGKFSNRRVLARELAKAERFDELRFISLANQFRVSIEAMAIRLEELMLLD